MPRPKPKKTGAPVPKTGRSFEPPRLELLESLLEFSPLGIVTTDLNAYIVDCNQALLSIFGFSEKQELIGQNAFSFIAPQDIPKARVNFVRRIGEKYMKAEEYTFLNKDQKEIFIELSIGAVRDVEGKPRLLVGVIRDISRRKIAEELLQKKQALLENVFQFSPEGITVSDLNGVIIDCNPVTLSLHGFTSKAELLGRNALELIAPPDHERAGQGLKKTLELGAVRALEYTLLRKDGSSFPGELSASLIRDSAGKPQAFMAITQDITEKKQTIQKLFEAQKMEAIGTLAGGIAHNFNNMLTIIKGCNKLLQAEISPAHPFYQFFQAIDQTSDRAAQLAKQLLSFSKNEPTVRSVFGLNLIIKRVVTILQQTFDRAIEIETDLKTKMDRIEGDSHQLEQVLLNLSLNARDAMPSGGKLRIETRDWQVEEAFAANNSEAGAGDYLRLQISDTGPGIPKEIQSRVFEPFFTTKPAGVGTGIGLAFVYAVVKNHKGFIQLKSEVDQGTTFQIYLPTTPLLEKPLPVKPPLFQPTGHETVLFVDDEYYIAKLGEQFLNRLGYKTIIALNGKEAVEIYKSKAEQISLVVLDLAMPIMGGIETCQQLKKINPAVKVIISSGYNANGLDKEMTPKGYYIQKPFNVDEFAIVIRKALDDP